MVAGLQKLAGAFGKAHTLLVGEGGAAVETFLSRPISEWVRV